MSKNLDMIFQFSGRVIHGLQLGRKIGFRTANIKLSPGNIGEGTYKIHGFFDKTLYSGVGSYLEKKGVFEAHFFDFNDDIYGKKIQISVYGKIRENKKFNSLSQIKKQIQKDIKYAKNHPVYTLTFGTFDVVHKGHLHYLQEAKKYGDRLICIVARNTHVIDFKKEAPLKDEQNRKDDISKLEIADKVFIGEKNNPLKWISKYQPCNICLGYDQKGFSNDIEKYITENKLEAVTVRIPAFKEKKYKSSLIKKKNLQK